MKRLTVAVFLFLLIPGAALADGPPVFTGTLTGVIQDQDPLTGDPVTRTITMTLVFTQPLYVISPHAYTGTFDSGNSFALDRSATYGDVISGAGALMLFLYAIYYHTRNLIRGNA